MLVRQQYEAKLLFISNQFLLSHLFSTSPQSPPFLTQLLSLGGRSCVALCHILVGLQPQGTSPLTDCSPSPGLGPSIDMQRVQTLVEEMGSSLSPGAQSLMEMVNVQQKVMWSQAFSGGVSGSGGRVGCLAIGRLMFDPQAPRLVKG